MNSKIKKKEFGINRKMWFITVIFCTVLAITIIFPILVIVFTSFKNNKEFYNNIFGLPEIWRFDNYIRAWTVGGMLQYVSNSIIITVVSVVVSLVLSAMAGYALSKLQVPMSDKIMLTLMGLNFIPGVAIYISLYRQMIDMGLNKTLYMLILPYIAWHIPFSSYIFRNFFGALPGELLESARADGAGEVRTFLFIVIPLAKAAISTVVVFNFIGIWGEFLWASIASSSSSSIMTIPVGMIKFKGEFGIEWGPFAAAIITVVLPMVIVFSYFQKYFIQGLTAGAIKG